MVVFLSNNMRYLGRKRCQAALGWRRADRWFVEEDDIDRNRELVQPSATAALWKRNLSGCECPVAVVVVQIEEVEAALPVGC